LQSYHLPIMLPRPSCLNPLRFLQLSLTLSVSAFAQQTAPSPTAPLEEKALELSPFEVKAEKDEGYLAQNTTSGSRLSTSLKDTPAAISIFTKEFLEDIGATDIDDLLKYSINSTNTLENSAALADVQLSGGLVNNDPAISIRGVSSNTGFGVGGRLTNFFITGLSQNTYNTERVELTRGPNSVLYGIGPAAGGFNVSTKKADFGREHYETTFRFGSDEQWRATVDINQPLIRDRLALRINAVNEDENGWRSHAYNQEQRYQIGARWQIAAKTRLDAEYESGHQEFAQAPNNGINDSITPWIVAGRKLDTQTGAPFPPNAGLAVLGNFVVYDTTTGTVYNERNQSVSAPAGATPGAVAATGELSPQISDFSLVPREVFLGGPAFGTNRDFERWNATFSHELVKGLFVEAAFNRETYDTFGINTLSNAIQVDTNANLPNGAPNPRAGQFYVEQNVGLSLIDSAADDYRLTASYDFDPAAKWSRLQRWMGKQRFATLYQHRELEFATGTAREAILTNPNSTVSADNNANLFRRRTYFDLSGPAGLIALQDYRDFPVSGLVNTTTGLPITTGFVPSTPRDTLESTESNLYVWQGRFVGDRLVGTVGYRQDRVKTLLSTVVRDAPIAPFTQGLQTAVRNATADHASGITRTQGLVAHATSWASLFYNHSTSFQPPARTVVLLSPTLTPLLPPSSRGETDDYGVKLSLLGGRLFATITAYETTGLDQANNGGVGTYITAANNIWNALNNAGVLAANNLTLDAVTTFANGFTFDRKSTGVELELTANPTPSWRLSLNYSANKTIQSDSAAEISAYFAANEALFTSGTRERLVIGGTPGQLAATAVNATDGLTTVREQINSALASFTDQFLNSDGARQLGEPVAQANLRSTYSHRDGRLKGFSWGGGLRWRGERVIAYTSSDPATRQEIRGASTLTVDANLGYRRKLSLLGRKTDFSVQLNINNLLDEDDLIYTRAYTSGTPRTFDFPTPREWFVTTTLRF
jgi:outer membrane receptor protein involved in Fe transport